MGGAALRLEICNGAGDELQEWTERGEGSLGEAGHNSLGKVLL